MSLKAQNERKLICYKGIRKRNRLPAPKKQTQNKPNFKPDDGFSAYYTRDWLWAQVLGVLILNH